MSTKPKDQTDIVAGLFFMALGGFFGWQALGMEIGTSIRMGPGYFPMVLSGLLSILGAVILFKAFGRADDEPFGRIAWRGILFILPASLARRSQSWHRYRTWSLFLSRFLSQVRRTTS